MIVRVEYEEWRLMLDVLDEMYKLGTLTDSVFYVWCVQVSETTELLCFFVM